MNDMFEKRVRAAAVEGWWVILVAVAFLLVVWLVYLAIMSTQPAWFLALCGPDVSWPFLQNLCLWMVSIFKLCVWLMFLVVLWLTLWARQLRKQSDGK